MDTNTVTIATDWAAASRFASALAGEIAAQHVYLFGSRVRGQERGVSDYDFIIVSPRYEDVPFLRRGRNLYAIWDSVGGYGPIDLLCLTPDEFEAAQRRISVVATVLPEAIDLLAQSLSPEPGRGRNP